MRKITFASGFPDYIPKIELEEIDNSVKSTRRIGKQNYQKIPLFRSPICNPMEGSYSDPISNAKEVCQSIPCNQGSSFWNWIRVESWLLFLRNGYSYVP
mgnify:CR=1 FL=1